MPRSVHGIQGKKMQSPGQGGINNVLTALYEWTNTIIFSLICVIIAFIFFFRIVGVVGPSMNPALIGSVNKDDKSGDRLLVYTFMYKPSYRDIVIVDRYTADPLIKRVIALEGDKIQLLPHTNEVMVNHVVLDEPYAVGTTAANEFGTQERTVPPGHVVVFGDNRSVSKDSRMKEIDFVSVNDIIGRAFFRFSPMDRFGKI